MAGGVNPSLSLKPLNTRVIKARRWCLISGKQREDKPSLPLPSVLLRLSMEGTVLNLGRNNHQITNKHPHLQRHSETMSDQLSKNPRPFRSDSESWKTRYPGCTVEFERWQATSAQPWDPHRPRSPSQISVHVQDRLLAFWQLGKGKSCCWNLDIRAHM